MSAAQRGPHDDLILAVDRVFGDQDIARLDDVHDVLLAFGRGSYVRAGIALDVIDAIARPGSAAAVGYISTLAACWDALDRAGEAHDEGETNE